MKLIKNMNWEKCPEAVLITQGEFCFHSAGGIVDVSATLRPTPSITPATKHSNAPAEYRGLGNSRETGLLICGPGGCDVTGGNPKVELPGCQHQGWLIKSKGLLANFAPL